MRAIYSFAASGLPLTDELAKNELSANPFPKDNLTSMYQRAAKDILERTNVKQGFCLVLGSENGRLAYELAKLTDLAIVCIEPDEKKVEGSRQALAAAGLYGHRVTVHHADPSSLPYSNYFANLIVSDSLLLTGKIPGDPSRIARHLKPCGGVVCLGKPENSPGPRPTTNQLTTWLEGMQLEDQAKVETDLPYATLTRGKLPGGLEVGHISTESQATRPSATTSECKGAWACCGTAIRGRARWSIAMTCGGSRLRQRPAVHSGGR